jgi:hypothetical protein
MLLKRLTDPGRTLTAAGMLCLVLGSTTGMVLRHSAPLSPIQDKLGDGLYGMFYGMSIALMLLGLRMKMKARARQ